MAVVNVNSTQIANDLLTPPVLNNPYIAGGIYRECVDVCTAGASDSAGSTYRFCRVPSNARIGDVEVMNDANTSGTSYKCGVIGINGGAVPVTYSDQIFFSAVSMASARNVWTSLYFPSILNGSQLVANVTLRVWELLGLSADPNLLYDVVITATTAGSAGGKMAVKFAYIT